MIINITSEYPIPVYNKNKVFFSTTHYFHSCVKPSFSWCKSPGNRALLRLFCKKDGKIILTTGISNHESLKSQFLILNQIDTKSISNCLRYFLKIWSFRTVDNIVICRYRIRSFGCAILWHLSIAIPTNLPTYKCLFVAHYSDTIRKSFTSLELYMYHQPSSPFVCRS